MAREHDELLDRLERKDKPEKLTLEQMEARDGLLMGHTAPPSGGVALPITDEVAHLHQRCDKEKNSRFRTTTVVDFPVRDEVMKKIGMLQAYSALVPSGDTKASLYLQDMAISQAAVRALARAGAPLQWIWIVQTTVPHSPDGAVLIQWAFISTTPDHVIADFDAREIDR